MSTQIPVAFEKKYAADFITLAQQKGSRLRSTVRTDASEGGKHLYFDRVGATAMQRKTSRHMDTPTVDTPHSRRRVSVEDYVWADLIDRVDMIKMTKSPQNVYMTSGMNAAGRTMDDIIIAAANGSATTEDEDDTTSTVALPSAQKIAVASAGLTLAKVLNAKEILDAAEIDEMDRVMVYTAKQQSDVLALTTFTSSDFAVKALLAGQVTEFLGFRWVRSERLTVDSSSDRLCLAYAKSAMGLYLPQDITARVSERADKNYSIQTYVELSLGAVRIEDAGVVQIACSEA
jgi:hypothetical protein